MKQLILLIVILLAGCTPSSGQQALGTIERDRITFTATSNEIIRALPTKEGSQVNVGDVLVKLDDKSQQAILAQAVAQKAKAQAYLLRLTNGERPEDIAAARARVDKATAQLTDAEKNYRRLAELVTRKLISQSERDTALASRDSARAELDSTREEFRKLTAGARLEDIDQARAELEAAAANVALQQQKLDDLTILSTRDGVLDDLPYHVGERVPVNAIVAVLEADTTPYARVYVPEPHRISFLPGKTVSVHVDGLENPLRGKVRWVASEPSFTPYYALTENERARLMYLAEVDLEDSANKIPSGIPAQVDLSGEQ